jgi:hypothetical protein
MPACGHATCHEVQAAENQLQLSSDSQACTFVRASSCVRPASSVCMHSQSTNRCSALTGPWWLFGAFSHIVGPRWLVMPVLQELGATRAFIRIVNVDNYIPMACLAELFC